MKIALFTDTYPPAVNGVAVHVSSLANALAHNGHQVLVCVPGHAQSSVVYPNLQYYSFSSVPSLVYPDVRLTTPFSPSCLRVTRDFQPNVIHFHTPGTIGLNGILIGKRLKIPVVGSFHTYFMDPEYLKIIALDKLHLHENETIISLGWKISNSIYNKCDHIVTYSENTRQDLIKNGIKKPVDVINNSIRTTISETSVRTAFAGSHSLPEKYFIYVGRLSKEKSLDILLHAFDQFSREVKNVDLVMVGDGPARAGLEELSKSMGLETRIHFLGMIDHAILENSDLVSNAVAFVSASTSEVKPLSVLEAIACGLPIIGVNAKGMPELISGNGILCKPDDPNSLSEALKTINSDDSIRNKMSEESKRIAATNIQSETTEQIEKIYQNMIEKKI